MTSHMQHPFPKSLSPSERWKRLQKMVNQEDTLGIFIDADPDAMASALALKRLFWHKVRRTYIYHINVIQRADNLALIRLLKIDQQHIRHMKPSRLTKWAILDSQPHHHERLANHRFDIIIDHHPFSKEANASFVDIRDTYGANSTIMTEYLQAAKIRPSPKLATALFYGIKTDTDNFVRGSGPNDIEAFRYLYKFANMNIIKKIESSEITKKTLMSYKLAMERLVLFSDIAFVHMDKVENPDVLVIIADFFMRLVEATWSIVSGICHEKLIVIVRNAGFRRDAGRAAQMLFGNWGGTAGGHKTAARAEIPLKNILEKVKDPSQLGQFVLKTVKQLKQQA